MTNANLELIEKLTWAIVEVTNPTGKPDLKKVAEALELALVQALIAKDAGERLQHQIIKTAQVMGE